MAAPPTARALDEPVVDDGIRWLNFFNGRSLSAEDLRVDHAAIQRARGQLGQGIGAGVVAGFEVVPAYSSTVQRPVLSVGSGLAFNTAGQAIELRRRVAVGLVRVDAPTASAGATFEDCDVVLAGTTGLGAYVLTVGPADAPQGKAPVAGLGNEEAGCNTAFSVEGVRFRLFPVAIDASLLGSADLRNRLAYRMFGQDDPGRLSRLWDPFTARDEAYGDLHNVLRESFETDVPLALLFWQPGEGLRFVDMWSVRRRPTPASPSTSHATPQGDRAAAEAEARYLQFEDHISDLYRPGVNPASIVAREVFRYLPPAGVVPLPTPTAYETFFRGLKVRPPVWIEGTHVEGLLRESLTYEAISSDAGEAIWLYVVRENAHRPRFIPEFFDFRDLDLGPIDLISGAGFASRANLAGRRVSFGDFGGVELPDEDAGDELRPSCVIFTTGHMRYRGDARFDLAYYDFANYAEIG